MVGNRCGRRQAAQQQVEQEAEGKGGDQAGSTGGKQKVDQETGWGEQSMERKAEQHIGQRREIGVAFGEVMVLVCGMQKD